MNDAYAKGKISEQHYKLLNDKISDSENYTNLTRNSHYH
jgi:hypothetical protein